MKNYLLYLKERLSLRSNVPPLFLAALFIAFIRLCASASLLTFFLFFITLICCVDLIRLNRFLFCELQPLHKGIFGPSADNFCFLPDPLRSTAFLVLAVAAFIWFASGGPESEAPALCSAPVLGAAHDLYCPVHYGNIRHRPSARKPVARSFKIGRCIKMKNLMKKPLFLLALAFVSCSCYIGPCVK